MVLPRYARRDTPIPDRPLPPQRSAAIAIIQSDLEMIHLLQKKLPRGRQDRHVEVLKDAEQALEYFSGAGAYGDRTLHPLPSAIVCDLNLPGNSGFTVLAWLREQPLLTAIPVFILTTSRQLQDVQRAYALGAQAYFVKPMSDEVLASLLLSIAGAAGSNLEGKSLPVRSPSRKAIGKTLPPVEEGLKRIVVGSCSESSQISAQKTYKVRIGPRWYEGRFSKRWFGWLFEDFGDTGMQLNLIDEVFEVAELGLKWRPRWRSSASREPSAPGNGSSYPSL
jgi:CheY-like chemotaxis protein